MPKYICDWTDQELEGYREAQSVLAVALAHDTGAFPKMQTGSQLQQIALSQLPTQMSATAVKFLTEIGVKFIGQDKHAPQLQNVVLPEGFKIVPKADDIYRSYLVTEDGHIVGTIFYKAAFYDSCANFLLNPEFQTKN